jgi:hypothetical protein
VKLAVFNSPLPDAPAPLPKLTPQWKCRPCTAGHRGALDQLILCFEAERVGVCNSQPGGIAEQIEIELVEIRVWPQRIGQGNDEIELAAARSPPLTLP